MRYVYKFMFAVTRERAAALARASPFPRHADRTSKKQEPLRLLLCQLPLPQPLPLP